MLEDIYNKVYWVAAKASAYYSGQEVCDGIFVSKELWDQVEEDDLGTVWYHELAGKHSECEADTTATLITEDNIKEVLLDYHESDGEEWRITESYLDGQDEKLVNEIYQFHIDFIAGISFDIKVTCIFGNEEVVL